MKAEVVEERQRARAHDRNVSGNGRHQIASEVLVASGHHRHLGFRAHAVGALHHDRVGHAGQRIA